MPEISEAQLSLSLVLVEYVDFLGWIKPMLIRTTIINAGRVDMDLSDATELRFGSYSLKEYNP
jgi:hypothetical protein